MKLIDYLAQLNTSDNTWGLYINLDNYDDYRIGQVIFENGGLLDNKVFVDTLDNISFGFNLLEDVLDILLVSGMLHYKNRKIKINKDKIKQYYLNNNTLDKKFRLFIDEQVEQISKVWSYLEAEYYINHLPLVLSEQYNK